MLYREHLKEAFVYKSGRPPEELLKSKGIRKIYPLASNENYLGPCVSALFKSMQRLSETHIYPDTIAGKLRAELAGLNNIPEGNVLVGAGSSELLSMLYTAFVETDEEILAPTPTFMLYKVLAGMYRLKLSTYPLDPVTFEYDEEEIIKRNGPKTKIIFVTSPNNPTGTIMKRKGMDRLLSSIRDDQILVVDEAYIEFNDSPDAYRDLVPVVREKNVILVRTFSKIYGCAGMRVGYLFARDEIIEGFLKVLKPFTITSMSEETAYWCLQDPEYRERTVTMVKEAREFLYPLFDREGFDYIKGYGNFIFMKVKNAEQLYDKLLEDGIVVRPTAAFGYAKGIRITYGDAEAMTCLFESLRKNRDLLEPRIQK